MTSTFLIHNVKISLKLQVPYYYYFVKTVEHSTNIKYKIFPNFLIIYSKYTYIIFKALSYTVHCNVTKIKKYDEIYKAKRNLKELFSDIVILSTTVDNICATRKKSENINLDLLFTKITQDSSFVCRINYNSQKFPGLFVKFSGNPISGTLIIFKSGTINYLGMKNPNHFLKVDKWINKWVYNV